MKNEQFLCSEMVRLTTGRKEKVGNLEKISTNGCTVTMDAAPSVGTQVRMRCLVCPLGRKTCKGCKFNGRVRSKEKDPVLGCIVDVDFQGRTWSAEEWHPRHLTNIADLALEPLPDD